jgi:PAS domain S-box-containing protein
MDLLKKFFQKLFLLDSSDDLASLEQNKARIMIGLCLIGAVVFPFFGILHTLNKSYIVGFFEISAAFVLLCILVIARRGFNEVAISMSIFVLILLYIYVLVSGGYEQTGLFWLFTFPSIFLALKGSKQGLYWAIILFAFVIVVTLFQGYGILDSIYPANTIKVLLISLFVVFLLNLISQLIQERAQMVIIKQKEDLKNSNVILDNAMTRANIAERDLKKALEQLRSTNLLIRQEKEKLSTMLQSIGDAVLVLDKDKKVVLVNKMVTDLTKFSAEDLLGSEYNKHLKFTSAKDQKTPNSKFIDRVYSEGKLSKIEEDTILYRKDGSHFVVGDSAAPLKDEDNNVVGCVVVFRDITKEYEIDKMKTEFVSVASHQLKAPVAGVKWLIESLAEKSAGNLTKEQEKILEDITEYNERMNTLVSDLLNVSRIESGRKFSIVKRKTDVVPMIKHVIEEEQKGPVAKIQKIKLVLSDKLPKKLELDIDDEKIKQVFHNLVNNAIKYSKEDGEVKFDFEKKDKSVVFSVVDSGLGIPKDQQYRVFEKFFRAENVQSLEREGTGLGLYIVKAIVEAHDGKIWFESEENKGTTFFVELPL